jgi:hypothetical protein
MRVPDSRGRRFTSRRSRPLAGFGATYGFLRPTRRHVEEEQRFLERLNAEPRLRREYRTSIAVQAIVVGLLLASIAALLVQSFRLLHTLRASALGPVVWGIPALAGLLFLAVLRRFLRLVSDFRRMGGG